MGFRGFGWSHSKIFTEQLVSGVIRVKGQGGGGWAPTHLGQEHQTVQRYAKYGGFCARRKP